MKQIGHHQHECAAADDDDNMATTTTSSITVRGAQDGDSWDASSDVWAANAGGKNKHQQHGVLLDSSIVPQTTAAALAVVVTTTDDRDEQCEAPSLSPPSSKATISVKHYSKASTPAPSSSSPAPSGDHQDDDGEFDRTVTILELQERHPTLFRWFWRDGGTRPHPCLLRLLEFEAEDDEMTQIMRGDGRC